MADDLSALHDIRSPSATIDAAIADGLISLGLGFALALVIWLALHWITRQRHTRKRLLRAELERSRGLPERERMVAQLRMLQALAGEGSSRNWPDRLADRFGRHHVPVDALEKVRSALYRPGSAADTGFLEPVIRSLLCKIRD